MKTEGIAEETKKYTAETIEPKFRKENELSLEQRTDPDYALRQLEKLNGGKLEITCSKCHHCR